MEQCKLLLREKEICYFPTFPQTPLDSRELFLKYFPT